MKVGHAIQDQDDYPPLVFRIRLVQSDRTCWRVGPHPDAGSVIMPRLRSPAAAPPSLSVGILTLGAPRWLTRSRADGGPMPVLPACYRFWSGGVI